MAAWKWIVGVVLAAALMGCNRPSEESCKKAIANIRNLAGTFGDQVGRDPRSALRSCRGNATRESVACMIQAETIADLKACEGEFAKMVPDEPAAEPGEAQ